MLQRLVIFGTPIRELAPGRVRRMVVVCRAAPAGLEEQTLLSFHFQSQQDLLNLDPLMRGESIRLGLGLVLYNPVLCMHRRGSL